MARACTWSCGDAVWLCGHVQRMVTRAADGVRGTACGFRSRWSLMSASAYEANFERRCCRLRRSWLRRSWLRKRRCCRCFHWGEYWGCSKSAWFSRGIYYSCALGRNRCKSISKIGSQRHRWVGVGTSFSAGNWVSRCFMFLKTFGTPVEAGALIGNCCFSRGQTRGGRSNARPLWVFCA